jgi:hypothetical protein
LGDPIDDSDSEISNRDGLLGICDVAEKHDIETVMAFMNFIDPDDHEVLHHIETGRLAIIYKLDSFDPELNAKIYGVSVERARRQLEIVPKLMEISRQQVTETGQTNIAFEIVPTTLNQHVFIDTLDCVRKNGNFAIYADLEESGKSVDENYQNLRVNDEFMQQIVEHDRAEWGHAYKRPICAATYAGIHLSHDLGIEIDSRTGSGCPWGLLVDPEMTRLGESKDFHYLALSEMIIAARQAKVADNKRMLADCGFRGCVGGCGGTVPEILEGMIRVAGP